MPLHQSCRPHADLLPYTAPCIVCQCTVICVNLRASSQSCVLHSTYPGMGLCSILYVGAHVCPFCCHAGKVWDACDAVKKQPLDNKAALFRQLAAVVRVAKDTLREVRHKIGMAAVHMPARRLCAYHGEQLVGPAALSMVDMATCHSSTLPPSCPQYEAYSTTMT